MSLYKTRRQELIKASNFWDTPFDNALMIALSILADNLLVPRVSVWFVNKNNNKLELSVYYSIDKNYNVDSNSKRNKNFSHLISEISSELRSSPDSLFLENRLIEWKAEPSDSMDISSALMVSLHTSGDFAGLLCIENTQVERSWNDDDKVFLLQIAELISHRLIQQKYLEITTDSKRLTSLHQSTLDGANYSIITTDINGVIKSFNAAASRMLGYTPEEIIDRYTPEILHDMDEVKKHARDLSDELGELIKPGFECFVAKSRKGIAEEREWTYIRKDGVRFPVLLSVTALHDDEGGINGFLGIAIDITDRLLMKRALHEEEARYRTLFENANDAIFLMKDELFIDCNKATLRMFNCTRDQIVNKTPIRFSPEYQPDGRLSKDKAIEKIGMAIQGKAQSFEWLHLRYDGTPFHAEVSLNGVVIEGGMNLLATVRDVTSRKLAEEELKASRIELLAQNENLRVINNLSTRLHATTDITSISNEVLDALMGLSRKPLIAIYLLDDESVNLELLNAYGFDEAIVRQGQTLPLEGSLSGLALELGHILLSENFSVDRRLEDAMRRSLVKSGINSGVVIPLIYQSRPLGSLNLLYKGQHKFSGTEIDTLETIGKTMSLSIANSLSTHELEFMAHHDSLTGLPNRSLLHYVFDKYIALSSTGTMALLLVDLDRFKDINDTLGHHIGDRLLQLIGPRISDETRDYKAQICRLGGDEFTILIQGIKNHQQVDQFAQSILQRIREPFIIDSMTLEVDASIGVAMYPENGKDSHELLRSADVAMYRAKNSGGGVSFYDKGSDDHTLERLALAVELGGAIREDQLVLHYQPKLILGSKNVTGFEALVRWNHPERGLLYPDSFIHLAEVGESIHHLTDKVLQMALQQQKEWSDSGYRYSVAVNLSARNLIDDRCIHKLKYMLDEYKTEPGMLELEITETTLMQDPQKAIELLNEISSLGVKLSIDDFGTGYSSLAYLRQLPIDALKIDRVFVKDMLVNEQDAIIVRSTIALAHNLGLNVIAEGVEDLDTMNALKQMSCDMVQGYYISKPKDWKDISYWLDLKYEQ